MRASCRRNECVPIIFMKIRCESATHGFVNWIILFRCEIQDIVCISYLSIRVRFPQYFKEEETLRFRLLLNEKHFI